MASYFPMVKNSAQRIVFPILDADGDPVTGAAGDTPDSEYSLDGAGFSDCNDEIHEMAVNSGVYYLDLLAGETNGDVVCIQVKTATAGTKTTVLVFYTSAQSLDTIDAVVDGIQTDLSNATDGLSALKALIDTIDTVVDGIKTITDNLPDSGALTTINNYVDLIDDATNGLAAIKAEVEGLAGAAMRGTDNAALAAAWTAALATALGNYTAARAGYLDQLDFALQEAIAAIPTTAMRGTDNAATEAKQDIIDSVVDALKVIADKLNSAMEADGAVHRFTENALEEAPAGGNGGGASAEEIDTQLTESHGEGSWREGAGGGWIALEGWPVKDRIKALKQLDEILTLLKKKLDITAYQEGLAILGNGLSELLQSVRAGIKLNEKSIKFSVDKLTDQMDGLMKADKIFASKDDIKMLKESLSLLLTRDEGQEGYEELEQKILGVVNTLTELKGSIKANLEEIVAPLLPDEALERMVTDEGQEE